MTHIINRCKYLLCYSLLLLLVIGCHKSPKIGATELIDYEIKKIDRKTCVGDDCATVSISFPVFGEPTLQTAIERRIVQGMSYEQQPETLSLDSAIIVFLGQFEDLKAEFPVAASWEYEQDVRVSFQNASMLSLVFDSFSFTGGAHPNSFRTFINYDLDNSEVLSNSKLILDEEALLEAAELEFRKHHEVEEGINLKDDGRFFLNENGGFFKHAAIGFEGGYLILYYNPYEIGPYVMGPTELRIPYSDLRGIIAHPRENI